MHFIEGYQSLLLHIAHRYGISGSPRNPLIALTEARHLACGQRGGLLGALEASGLTLAQDVVDAVASLREARWVLVRSTTQHAFLMDAEETQAYAVKALTTPLHQLGEGSPSILFTGGLMAYDGAWVCDGLAADPVEVGPRLRTQFKERLRLLRAQGRFSHSP